MGKLAAVWTWLTASIIPLAVLAVMASAFLYGVRGCRDNNQSAEAAVMKEKLRGDSLLHINDSIALSRTSAQLDTALVRGTQVVTRWHTVKEPVYLPASSTPHDTIQSFAKRLSACYAAGDTLVQSIVKIQSTCSAFRDTAAKTIADQRTAYAHLDSLYKIGKPPRRWSIGPFVGYGFHQDSAWAIRRGFSAGIGITYSILRW